MSPSVTDEHTFGDRNIGAWDDLTTQVKGVLLGVCQFLPDTEWNSPLDKDMTHVLFLMERREFPSMLISVLFSVSHSGFRLKISLNETYQRLVSVMGLLPDT